MDVAGTVISGKEDAVICRSLLDTSHVLVRMVSPSVSVDEDKVSLGQRPGVGLHNPWALPLGAEHPDA